MKSFWVIQRMMWQASLDSLSLNLWKRSAELIIIFNREGDLNKSYPKKCQKTKNEYLLIEMDSQRHAENILKMKTFHMPKCKAYPHEKLNTSKGVIRSRELSLTTVREIRPAIDKQRVKLQKNNNQKG